MREKLIELLNNSFERQYEKRGLLTAQHTATDLIANGVTMEAYDCHWATETAYKNGYKQGLEDATKWISVKDRLPKEDDGVVLVYSSGVEPAVFTGDIFLEYDKYEGWEINNVTHWTPLPEPPKGE